ncbi:hypothetical protein DL765_000128 [Monosporascus sp. GIB2]|nr:hypothetical protein DL765_000128 [Monosporascus sp. GIB2]
MAGDPPTSEAKPPVTATVTEESDSSSTCVAQSTIPDIASGPAHLGNGNELQNSPPETLQNPEVDDGTSADETEEPRKAEALAMEVFYRKEDRSLYRVGSEMSASEEPLQAKDRPLKPEVRYYDYEGYMNRMIGDEGDYIIEVLVTKSTWGEDIIAEEDKRRRRVNPEHRVTDRRREKTRGASRIPLTLSRAFKTLPQGEGRIQSIRIRSKTVLCALAALSENSDLEKYDAVEFRRPFRTLEYFHKGMKNKLIQMENARADEEDLLGIGLGGASSETNRVPQDGSCENAPAATSTQEAIDPKLALEEMKCYISFVELNVLPIRSKFEDYGEKTRPRIRFEEIPYLFRPGALAFLHQETKSAQTLQRSAVQQVWRITACRPAEHELRRHETPGTTGCDMYCLDYDGDKLVPIWETFRFRPFEGERDITSLGCYPLAFHPNYSEILEEQKQNGQDFKSYITESVRHLFYSGWTLIEGIRGETLEDDKGDQIQYSEYIESEVVIDFKETLRNHPRWETEVIERRKFDYSWFSDLEVETPFRIWEDNPRDPNDSRRYIENPTLVLTGEYEPYKREANTWIENDIFLTGDAIVGHITWTDEALALLPRRLFGYAFRERRFAPLDVRCIDKNTRQRSITLDNIQMKDHHRKMIRSAVSAHFRARQKEKQGLSTINLDVIRGKGKGLVILLHGPPGVGKTATTEAVAIENRKPLFPITCGDLGFSPSAVDKSLRDIFRYAHLWECILLLDEADVFLTQRDRSGGNFERNALVGVFLRVLEYYSGILFLTTNRVGALDEAFQSRIHLSLCYPHLSLDDTLEVLRSNLNRLPRVEQAKDKSSRDRYIKVLDAPIRDFVKAEYEQYSKANNKKRGPWNGRQIRNAVQIAAGLALYDKEASDENDGLPAILTADHFRSVAETTTEFEEYVKSAKKGDDTFLSRTRQDRNDDFYEEGAAEYPSYRGDSDAESSTTPQRPKAKGPVPGPAWSDAARRKARTSGAGLPERTSPLRLDEASANYFGRSRRSASSGKRPQHGIPEDGDEEAEDS